QLLQTKAHDVLPTATSRSLPATSDLRAAGDLRLRARAVHGVPASERMRSMRRNGDANVVRSTHELPTGGHSADLRCRVFLAVLQWCADDRLCHVWRRWYDGWLCRAGNGNSSSERFAVLRYAASVCNATGDDAVVCRAATDGTALRCSATNDTIIR